jgi:hypothetical protein
MKPISEWQVINLKECQHELLARETPGYKYIKQKRARNTELKPSRTETAASGKRFGGHVSMRALKQDNTALLIYPLHHMP